MSFDRKKAFTMAEAILTMVILGVIAAIMIANLKPVLYRNEGFKVTKKKVYAELDDVINTILVSCTSGMTLSAIYDDCDEKNPANTHSFGATKSGHGGLGAASPKKRRRIKKTKNDRTKKNKRRRNKKKRNRE